MRQIALLCVVLLLGFTSIAVGEDHHVKADLAPNGNSGVSGFVQLTQLPHGGTNLHVMARGLKPGSVYASFYYESADCTEPADKIASFTGGDDGTAEVNMKIDDDIDEVGSVSVRVGPGYGDLLACAKIH